MYKFRKPSDIPVKLNKPSFIMKKEETKVLSTVIEAQPELVKHAPTINNQTRDVTTFHKRSKSSSLNIVHH